MEGGLKFKMGLLNFFFKGEKKEDVKKPEELLPSEQIELKEGSVICAHCKNQIFSYEKRKRMGKDKVHRKCYKKLKKNANKVLYGN